MKAVILAGGKGSRLGQETREIPKPMLTIGDKPLLQHQVELLVRYGFTDIIILVNYLKDSIISHFGNGEKFNARINYFEESEPLGTVGGIKEIETQLQHDFLVLYGDVMVNMNLLRLVHFHTEKESQCTLVLHPNDHPYDSDLVDMDNDDRITAFHNKPHKEGVWYSNMVNAGVYVFSPALFHFMEKGKKADFGRDVFPAILQKVKMIGYHTSEYLKDMGTPDRLEKVRVDWESGRIRRSNYDFKQAAVFLDRDGVLNTERSYISKPEELEVYDFVPEAVQKINQAGYLSVVVTNQSAIARNLCTEEDIQLIHKKLSTILGNSGAWIDAIYYCPHHPDKGFPEENPTYKIDCECRKPKTGMFLKAIEKFNIDPALSYMIGDSERDIQAGINTGCITIGVRTGYGIKKTCIFPDYMFSNLAEAVDFIITDPYKEHFSEIFNRFSVYRGKTPWMILIGGNTRSGKSTFASYLRIAFRKAGYKALQISLDNWLVPESNRTPGMNVYERFQVASMEKDILNMLSGKKITGKTYANHPLRNPLPVEYDAGETDILILEGVVALSSAALTGQAHLKIFMQVQEQVFVQRMMDYYSWREKSKEETLALVDKRQTDEYQIIEKESKLADLFINSYGS